MSKKKKEDRDAMGKTLYLEARGEPDKGIEGVGWVIRNRARMNRTYWGGKEIRDVCLNPDQFECWKNRPDFEIAISDPGSFKKCKKIAKEVIKAREDDDPTKGCDHYNNPEKEGYPPWTENCDRMDKIGGHQFYRTKKDRV